MQTQQAFSEKNLTGKRVAILVTEGFEQVELTEPKKTLDGAGAQTVILCPGSSGTVRARQQDRWGDTFEVGMPLSQANPGNFDALVLPGGVMNPDKLRLEPEAVEFVRAFMAAGKPVAAICHGPWLLVEADVVRGRTLTSYPSLRTDIRNAGGNWVDREVVVDNGLITSRDPDDLFAFNTKILEEIAEGRHNTERVSQATPYPQQMSETAGSRS